jgi:HPt (histidine-containing phosphotransfer) domain-containing protein
MDKHYSLESLKEIAGGDTEFMAIVAQTFLEEIPPDLQALTEAVANDNKELAYQFAHKMKPNIEMFGISALKDITVIEAWTRGNKNSSAVTENVASLNTALNHVFSEIKVDFA